MHSSLLLLSGGKPAYTPNSAKAFQPCVAPRTHLSPGRIHRPPGGAIGVGYSRDIVVRALAHLIAVLVRQVSTHPEVPVRHHRPPTLTLRAPAVSRRSRPGPHAVHVRVVRRSPRLPPSEHPGMLCRLCLLSFSAIGKHGGPLALPQGSLQRGNGADRCLAPRQTGTGLASCCKTRQPL